MFGRQPKETKPSDPSDLLDVTIGSQPPKVEEKLEKKSGEIKLFDSFEQETIEQQPEVINTVEKISKIISPYFIVIVGLSLYENNFLIGTALIAIGILSLLKVSWQDIVMFIETIKSIFVSTDPKN
jgi:hypothetical protein